MERSVFVRPHPSLLSRGEGAAFARCRFGAIGLLRDPVAGWFRELRREAYNAPSRVSPFSFDCQYFPEPTFRDSLTNRR